MQQRISNLALHLVKEKELCPIFALFAVQARVPRKPISANRGLNLVNRGIHFVPRLVPVPESMINHNLGIN